NHTDCPLTDFRGKTSIFSHPVYLFLRKFSLQDSRGGSICVVAIGLMTAFINPVFAFLTRVAVMIMQALGLQVAMPDLQPDAFPFWDSCMMVLSIVAMILMTRKYVENWLLWVIINVISVVIFALQGVYAMSLEYLLLTFIALNGSRMWINSARERGSRALSH
ncbi:nicotinamide riboside transporter PnuC, partial [Escherichia albertii]|uniref:nicotinamide riboside transporter PnuC n=1 Tax=Escherichia albertii TaxID=208962 RepID=UPI00307AC770